MQVDGVLEQQRTKRRNYFSRRKTRHYRDFLLLISPALLWFLIFLLWPLMKMFYYSTVRWNEIVSVKHFQGLQNYITLMSDYHFHNALINTSIHVFFGELFVIPPAIFLGFFLSQRHWGYRVMRTVFFSPYMISVAALAMLFYGIYMPHGILNYILQLLGLGALQHFWLVNPNTALGSIISVDIWGGIGFYSVLLFAAFSNLSPELYEAARLDGASSGQILRKVALPQVVNFVGILIVLHFLWLLIGSSQNVFLLTRGGPGDRTLTLGYYLFQLAFLTQRLGYSQAVAVVVFIIGIVGMLLIRKATRRNL